jgi:hypothetical protein
MRTHAFIFAAALALSLPATAGQVRFTGHTTANGTLVVDTLRAVATLGPGRFSCPTVEAVEAQVLPEAFKPPGEGHPEGKNPTIYERWDATFCGKVVPLLIAFWSAPEGGTMFRVGVPFPTPAGAP